MTTLSPAVRAFLEEKRYCVFADIGPDGLPHQTVLWYELQGDEIMMNIGRQRVKEPESPPRSARLVLHRRWLSLSYVHGHLQPAVGGSGGGAGRHQPAGSAL